MEEGLGPGVEAAVEELSQEEGRAGPAVFGGWGARRFFVDIWGLAESLVPAYTVPPFSVKSLEVEMLERGIVYLVSGALALVFPVTVMCCPGFPGCFPESRPWVLSLGAVVIRSQSACDELCGRGLSRDVHEQCLFWLRDVISVLVGFFNHMMTRKLI